jgi:ABC-type dipeptide/oligopeptide/nickel transport system permease component
MDQLFQSQRWWLVRIAALPLQILLFAFVAFFLVRAIPGDPVDVVTGGQYTPEIYARVQKALGLDGTLLEQLGRYLGQLLSFDLGTSLISGRSISDDLIQKLPPTIEIALMALVGMLLLTLAGSYIAVLHPRGAISRLVIFYSRTAGMIPEFALGIVAIFIFYAVLRLAPAPLGRLSPFLDPPPPVTHMPFVDVLLSGDIAAIKSMMAHLILPIGVMVIALTPVMLKLLVADLEASLDAQPTRFRIAAGATHATVLLSVYRRALPATVTMTGTMFGHLLGGAIIIESLFGLDGLGKYAVEAVMSADLTTMQSVLLVIATLSLIVFLLIDLVNMLLDPRRRPGTRVEA